MIECAMVVLFKGKIYTICMCGLDADNQLMFIQSILFGKWRCIEKISVQYFGNLLKKLTNLRPFNFKLLIVVFVTFNLDLSYYDKMY